MDDVIDQTLYIGIACINKVRNQIYTDNALVFGQALDLMIGQIAGMLAQ